VISMDIALKAISQAVRDASVCKGGDMDRIERIKAYNAAKKNAESNEKEAQRCDWVKLQEDISKLKPRIEELIKTANACLENGIEITNTYLDLNYNRVKDTYAYGCFVTNSITHRLGFVHTPGSKVSLLGIDAGGAFGEFHFRTDGNDTYSIDKDSHISAPKNEHMQKFLSSFNEFEESFYKYVDGIVGM